MQIPKLTMTAVKKAYAQRTLRILRIMSIGEEMEEVSKYRGANKGEESE
jgi:hypothetical protein